VNGTNTVFTLPDTGTYLVSDRVNFTAGLLLVSRILRNGAVFPGSTFSPAVSVGSCAVTRIAALTAGEIWKRYAEYKALRQDMIDYRTLKWNVDRLWGIEKQDADRGQKDKTKRSR